MKGADQLKLPLSSEEIGAQVGRVQVDNGVEVIARVVCAVVW